MLSTKTAGSRAPRIATLMGTVAVALAAVAGCQSGPATVKGSVVTAPAVTATITAQPFAAAATTAPAAVPTTAAPGSTLAPTTVPPYTPPPQPTYTPPAQPAYTPPPAPANPPPVPPGDGTYTNVDGNTIPDPVSAAAPPAGATAQCNDGTYSFSQHHSGTCSSHGGVAQWL
jgi:hypothetical protein